MIESIKATRKNPVIILAIVMFLTLMSAAIVHAAAIDESEPNNDKTSANNIRIGSAVYGVSDVYDYVGGTGNGQDWFKFAAPVSGTAYITVYCDSVPSGASGLGASVDVYDSNNNMINSTSDSLQTDSGSIITFGVVSGRTYYIRAYGSQYNFYREDISYHFTVGYSIGKTTIKKVKPAKKAFTVTWNKKAKTTFYQVQYIKKSVYQDYSWGKAKTIKVSSKSKSKKIKGLAKKKQYYVRVRVARTIGGVTYYSAWSPKKLVKTK